MSTAPVALPTLLRVALAAAAVAGLQVLLPRVFSVVLWYHLAFLAVSLAMLGFAAGGLAVRLRAAATGRPGGDLDGPLPLALASLAVTTALLGAVRIPVDPAALLDGLAAPLLLALLVVLLALPFVALGTAVAAGLDASRQRPGTIYGSSFLGAAAGAVLTLACMELWGTRAPAALLAGLPLLGALLPPLPEAGPRQRGVRWLPTVLATVALVPLLVAPRAALPLSSRKHFPRVAPDQLLEERSDATSHVLFYENSEHHGIAALAPGHAGPPPSSIAAAIDSWAITFITRRDGPEHYPPWLQHHTASLAWADLAPGSRALVIGAGGGWDVLSALSAGAGHVTAVEINPLIVDAVRGRWAAEAGRLYDDPRVTVLVAEGRHFVETHEERYDRIVLAGVDTFAATQAGAFALAENMLYTVESFRTLLRRLAPGGRLFLTRWWFEPPRQTLRLVLTLAEALRLEGVEDPRRRLFVAVLGNSFTVVKADADFTAAELQGLRSACARVGAEPVYSWSNPWTDAPANDARLAAALDADDPLAWAARYPYAVQPVTDDRPFFFEHGRLATLFRAQGNWIHDRLGGQEVLVVCGAVLALLCWPLLAAAAAWRRATGTVDGGPAAPTGPMALLPFGFVGLAYMLVEIPLMQRSTLLLGHPVLTVAVVLVALLAWSGLGALLADRLAPTRATVAPLMAAALVAGLLVAAWPPVAAALMPLALPLRVTGVVLLLGLPGLAMGTVFPLCLAALGRGRPLLVPSAFVWNGAASVLAGPLAVLSAMGLGFRSTMLLGAACYLGASATLWLAGRDTAEASRPPADTPSAS